MEQQLDRSATVRAAAAEVQILGSFYLNDCEIALPVDAIQEVVIPPRTLVPMPMAPAYLLGLFDLRGTIVPVIDVKLVLGLEAGDREWDAYRIAIIDHQGVNIGLRFDATGSILRARASEVSDFEYSGAEGQAAVVGGAVRLEGGARIVQVLDVDAIFAMGMVPHTEGQGRSATGSVQARRKQGLRTKCISFGIGEYRCAFQISSIHEIIKVAEIAESPLAGGKCIGLLNLRGDTVPVVDFARVLGYGSRARGVCTEDQRVIVMRIGNESFGLLVDRVDSIVAYEEHELLPVPAVSAERPHLVRGCIATADSASGILLLDHSEVLTNQEIEAITHGHAEVYQTAADVRQAARHGGRRSTYITFTMGCLFAAAIEEVREVIEHPPELLHPPELPERVKGVFNLRGEIVVIIDPADLSGDDHSGKNLKVLVFEKQAVKYGLVVQSVESIVAFRSDEKLPLPEAAYSRANHALAPCVKEAVRVQRDDGPGPTLMILDLEALARMVA